MQIEVGPEDVLEGLHVAGSVEVGLRALSIGLAPVWAVVGANALAEFPALGVEVTVIE